MEIFSEAFALRFALSVVPVLAILLGLRVLDRYRLVGLRQIEFDLGIGITAALVCLLLDFFLLDADSTRLYTRFGAPFLEEISKAAYVIYLVRVGRVGFMADAGIHGFAVGAGFAVLENFYYLEEFPDPNLFLWIERGFGPAVMHGGTTFLIGSISQGLRQRGSRGALVFLPGLALATLLHTVYDLDIFPPLLVNAARLPIFALIATFVILRSEEQVHKWLGTSFDQEVEMRGSLHNRSPHGEASQHAHELTASFRPEVLAEAVQLLCLSLELSIRFKGNLLRTEARFGAAPEGDLAEKFDQLRCLQRALGTEGSESVLSLLPVGSRHSWQLYKLGFRR